MEVRCLHCNSTFPYDPPPGGRGASSTECPACGRDTPATDDWTPDFGAAPSGPAAESRVYCFNCGKAMTPREGELIPVCEDCRRDAAQGNEPEAAAPDASDPVADWMIRKANGNVYGPFPSETIIDWIKARKINPDEEVAHIGGAWRLFGQHEEFGKCFERSAEAAASPPVGEIDFRRRSPIRDALSRGAGAGVAIVVGVIAIGGVIWAVRNHALVIPETALDKVTAQVSEMRSGESKGGTAMTDDARKMLDDLASKHAGATGSSMELFLRGRAAFLRDNFENLTKARDALEKAVVIDPENALALGALAETYNLLAASGYDTVDLQRQSIYLIQIAEATGDYPSEVLRARAAFLSYSGNVAEGRGAAEQGLQKNPSDPMLHFLMARTKLGPSGVLTPEARADFEKALELDPGFHQAWYALARAEEDAGHLKEAVALYQKKVELDGNASNALARLGAIQRAIGDYNAAAKSFDRAITVNPQERDAVLARAVLAYQVQGEPSRAVPLLRDLVAAPNLKLADRKSGGAHLAAALLLEGEPQQAVDAAEDVLKKDRTYGPALFQKAMAFIALGKPNDAMPLLTRAEDSGVSPRELAILLFHQGRAAKASGRIEEAAELWRRGRDVYPAFTPTWIALLGATAALGEAKLAATDFLTHVGSDPLEWRRDREEGEYFALVPPPLDVAQQLDAELQKEAFAPELATAVGVVWFHAGKYDEAERALKRGLQEDERNAAALFYRGLIARQTGQNRAALALLQAVAATASNNGVFYVYLADAQLADGKRDEAIASFERGLAYGGKSAWAYARMAEAMVAAGRADDAKAQVENGRKADPGAVAPRKVGFDIGA